MNTKSTLNSRRRVMNKNNKKSALARSIRIAIMSSIIPATFLSVANTQADDIDAFFETPSAVPPNILFILDESGSMSSGSLTASTSRNQALKNAMAAVIDDPELGNVNAAIMGYTTISGNSSAISNLRLRVMSDFVNITGNQVALKADVNGLQTRSYTPSTRALEAGVNWFNGGFTDVNSNTYASPLKPELYCAANSIVFLTDGQPNANNMTGYGGPGNTSTASTPPTAIACASNSYSSGGNGRCSQDIAEWAFNSDLRTWQDTQNIKTYTVSMINNTSAKNYLRSIARKGHGYTWDCNGALTAEEKALCLNDDDAGFYLAGSEAALVAALKSIVQSTQSAVTFSYSTPSIPVDISNVSTAKKDVFLPVFRPSVKTAWTGNLKKYYLDHNTNGSIKIRSITATGSAGGQALENDPASPNYNQFKPNARSAWGDSARLNDGADPVQGGVISVFEQKLEQASDLRAANEDFSTLLGNIDASDPKMGRIRRLFTYIDGTHNSTTILTEEPSAQLIPRNKTNTTGCSENTLINATLLGVATEDKCSSLIDWLVSGPKQVDTDPDGNPIIAYKFGAPIHTSPVVVNDITYLPTSDGILHAIDGKTGEEIWGFMPQELLKNVAEIVDPKDIDKNLVPAQPLIYGLDGNITTVFKDTNKNGVADNNEDTLLVFGQRRGGTNYYAIDVTHPYQPRLAYQIKSQGAFSDMRQTWSQPKFVRLDNALNASTPGSAVLIFGGGYDEDSETAGSNIYVVDAWTGNLKSKINGAGNSIVSRISTIDIDSDGLIDRLYAADVGGHIIRADLAEGTNNWSSYILADLDVKFFNSPTIGFESGSNGFLSVNIGSGNRPDPLASTTDYFFMVKDKNIWSKPSSIPTAITASSLLDVTNTTNTELTIALKKARGWKVKLPVGVKVFSQASLVNYMVVFTTYSKKSNKSIVCNAVPTNGDSFLYALNMLTGVGVFEDSTGTRSVRKELNISGIPPEPLVTTNRPTCTDGTCGKATHTILVGLPASSGNPGDSGNALSTANNLIQLNWEEVLDKDKN